MTPSVPQETSPSLDDPYLWLEEVDGERARAWVEDRKRAAEAELEAQDGYPALAARLRAILDSTDRIPYGRCHGGLLYNFWRDAGHPRGLWRRTTLDEYRKEAPSWDILIDLDLLARDEGENWVWGGVTWLEPGGERCLVSLSRGGGDAHAVREFDVAARTFVQGGFTLPEAKSDVAWIDHDTLFVGTDFGPGSLTESGYPRIVKAWRRGTPLSEAATVFEAGFDDLSVSAWRDATPGFEREFVQRQIGFYSSELFLRRDGVLIKVPKPEDANAFAVRDQLVIELRSSWEIGGRSYPQGALLAAGFDAHLEGTAQFEPLFLPSPTTSLDGLTVTRDALLLTILDKVKNRLVELRRSGEKWQARDVDLPAIGSLESWAFDRVDSNHYFLTTTGFTEPSTLYLIEAGKDMREPLKAMPAFFDAEGLQVHQFEATSKDGTRVPYFAVMRRDTRLDGDNPTVLYGYGGFEVSLKPSYGALSGAAWLESGGVYVVANIRGGGEFGPGWHQAALKEHRQRAFDDFIAVAEDLIERGISSPRRLGIMGGSNGGLLVGAVLTQRPELFNAVVCQVPLLDMRRYHQLLAGASWMGEYGDPDDPAEWAWIGRYSPYHQVRADQCYPRVLFTTSTRDDRVHPGHARKMAARMLDQGHPVLYWENLDGGHAGAADNAQTARMWALTWTFLQRQLRDQP
ncbi:prolyl oligopeptidase family serine peptidase [Massilia sp. IC2-477]|uniref:prolyl oligopeptidase family serine peptidase n=1 Tax=Massilia sp. IC2-477 TaxID=2887198 RepID=UPI001D11DB7F|nr:prolyl oligopeptidase family serine peptidase [Massilia sp. IC2-477]MCC2958503.1 prolyl oligopeptidase family serine peptidase [Massilia sp. IC2-477]